MPALPEMCSSPAAGFPRSVPATVPGLVIAGFGHAGFVLARDAVAAGRRVIGWGSEPERVRRLISGLAAEDPIAADLRSAIRDGRYLLTAEAARCAGFETALVVAPAEPPADPTAPRPVEVAAAALGPYLQRGALVIVAGMGRHSAAAEIVAATLELLTGLRAGPDFGLGYAIEPVGPPGASVEHSIVTGVDPRSARRTDEFYRNLGRRTARVATVEAAELFAMLQRGLLHKPDGAPANRRRNRER